MQIILLALIVLLAISLCIVFVRFMVDQFDCLSDEEKHNIMEDLNKHNYE